MKLNFTLQTALKDCDGWPRGKYFWKPASMEKLRNLGLVDLLDNKAFVVTPEGKQHLQETEGWVIAPKPAVEGL